MNVREMIGTTQLVVDPNGKPTGALLDIEIWQESVRFLEELEEQNMVRSYMTRRQSADSPQQIGLLSWETAERELEALLLAQSPTFTRLVESGLSEIKQGKTRPVEESLNELPEGRLI